MQMEFPLWISWTSSNVVGRPIAEPEYVVKFREGGPGKREPLWLGGGETKSEYDSSSLLWHVYLVFGTLASIGHGGRARRQTRIQNSGAVGTPKLPRAEVTLTRSTLYWATAWGRQPIPIPPPLLSFYLTEWVTINHSEIPLTMATSVPLYMSVYDPLGESFVSSHN